MTNTKLKILFLANRPASGTQASTVTEYLDALHKYSGNDVFEISMMHYFPGRIDLNRFDVVLLHYSLSIGPMINHYLGQDLIAKLKKFRGLKASFLQDEYREIKTYWKHINELGLDLLFSCVPAPEVPKVYPSTEVPHLQIVNVLTGYVSEELINYPTLPIKQRKIDVGYRTRKAPYRLGELGYEKWRIAEDFKKNSRGTGLVIDLSISERDRLYGGKWVDFIASCRSVIGVESGASIIDYDGNLERTIDTYMSDNPDATFEEVSQKFLFDVEGSLRLHQISPRCFEAAALRTPMVLFEGKYSGILLPHRHYIPLKKDFSNFDYVVSRLKDHSYLQELADRTFKEVAMNPDLSYRRFILDVDKKLQQEFAIRVNHHVNKPYSLIAFKRALFLSPLYFWQRKMALILQAFFLGIPKIRKGLFGLWDLLPLRIQKFIRPYVLIISR